MKKISLSIIFAITYIIANAAWVCYPPYGGGDGPNCFGSPNSCSQWNASGCKCDGASCCCYGAIMISPDGHYQLEINEENGHTILRNSTGDILWQIPTSSILTASNEVLQYNVLPDLHTIEFVIYDNNVFTKKMQTKGGIDKSTAILRTVKYVY